jgi:adenosylcobinamide kinase / adenosylcobinamide-phosphate guanylyltransferase
MKQLVLVTGGARAGKSRFAEQLAFEMGGDDVTYIATAEALDDDMRERIARHRADRRPAWSTIEEPLDLADALTRVTTSSRVVLVDCLTLWVSNLMLRDREANVDGVIDTYESRAASLILVTNEVGLGVVPSTPLGRRYRDVLGRVNQRIARRADRVHLVVAGIAIDVRALGRVVD